MSTELRAAFSRHETFPPRYGWLVKGTRAAAENPAVFLADDATTVLGVGKNMVRAIRFWCLAAKLIEEVKSPTNSRLREVHPTAFGQRLLDEGGWDPYLEDPASLWLLHWKLLAGPCLVPAWWSVFNTPRMQSFDEATLMRELKTLCDLHRWEDIAGNSLLKDIRCLLRMYAGVTSGRDLAEDSVDSPFSELELIRPVPGSTGLWAVAAGPKASLSDDILAYAVMDYLRAREQTARTLTISGLAQVPGSPGRAFGLTESSLADALQRVTEAHPDLMRFTHAAGVRQVALGDDVEPEDMLDAHYEAVTV